MKKQDKLGHFYIKVRNISNILEIRNKKNQNNNNNKKRARTHFSIKLKMLELGRE